MGYITVFALQECPHCKRSKAYLTARSIPYVEISLSTHPGKRTDMLSLSDSLTVPQFFFNEDHIGGANNLIAVVDKIEQGTKYSTFQEYYAREIADRADPQDERLRVPTSPPVVQTPPPPRPKERSVIMPDGSMASVLDVTSKLRQILPAEDLRYKIMLYKKVFTGRNAVKIFKETFNLSSDKAVEFGNTLIDNKIIDHVTGDHKFKDDFLFYRLQCYKQPYILNSFRIWAERVNNDSMALLERLRKILGKIESDATDNDGLVNYRNAHRNEYYPKFEEAVCELQGVDMGRMDRNTRLAFSINLYNMMIKYAFMKVGIGSSAGSRGAFFSELKFNIGGDILSFNDLEHGILRGNKKPAYGFSTQFPFSDSRARLALSKPDCRIHFALNCGAKSCPPVKNFTAVAIEEELRVVAQAFAEQENNIRIDEKTHTIHLTKILSWFRVDFAPSNKALPTKVVTFLRGKKKTQLENMIVSSKGITIKFNEYDWGTNASDFVHFDSSILKNSSPFSLAGWTGGLFRL